MIGQEKVCNKQQLGIRFFCFTRYNICICFRWTLAKGKTYKIYICLVYWYYKNKHFFYWVTKLVVLIYWYNIQPQQNYGYQHAFSFLGAKRICFIVKIIVNPFWTTNVAAYWYHIYENTENIQSDSDKPVDFDLTNRLKITFNLGF